MTQHRHIGLERQDGRDVGRDPRTLSVDELEQLGNTRVSPLRALRLKCLDCCNGSAQEVRLCTAVDCPSWPFRMGKNPWRNPLSVEERMARQVRFAGQSAAPTTEAQKPAGNSDALGADRDKVPTDPPSSFPARFLGEEPGGVS